MSALLERKPSDGLGPQHASAVSRIAMKVLGKSSAQRIWMCARWCAGSSRIRSSLLKCCALANFGPLRVFR